VYYELLEQLTSDRRDALTREAQAERLTAATRTRQTRQRMKRTLERLLRPRRTAPA
jgi:hypothetical protein